MGSEFPTSVLSLLYYSSDIKFQSVGLDRPYNSSSYPFFHSSLFCSHSWYKPSSVGVSIDHIDAADMCCNTVSYIILVLRTLYMDSNLFCPWKIWLSSTSWMSFSWKFSSGDLACLLEVPGWKYHLPLLSFWIVPPWVLDIPGRKYISLHLCLIDTGRLLLVLYVLFLRFWLLVSWVGSLYDWISLIPFVFLH